MQINENIRENIMDPFSEDDVVIGLIPTGFWLFTVQLLWGFDNQHF